MSIVINSANNTLIDTVNIIHFTGRVEEHRQQNNDIPSKLKNCQYVELIDGYTAEKIFYNFTNAQPVNKTGFPVPETVFTHYDQIIARYMAGRNKNVDNSKQVKNSINISSILEKTQDNHNILVPLYWNKFSNLYDKQTCADYITFEFTNTISNLEFIISKKTFDFITSIVPYELWSSPNHTIVEDDAHIGICLTQRLNGIKDLNNVLIKTSKFLIPNLNIIDVFAYTNTECGVNISGSRFGEFSVDLSYGSDFDVYLIAKSDYVQDIYYINILENILSKYKNTYEINLTNTIKDLNKDILTQYCNVSKHIQDYFEEPKPEKKINIVCQPEYAYYNRPLNDLINPNKKYSDTFDKILTKSHIEKIKLVKKIIMHHHYNSSPFNYNNNQLELEPLGRTHTVPLGQF